MTESLKVLITGPESSGKTTLAKSLAAVFDGIYVAEQARAYLNQRQGTYQPVDLAKILALQYASEELAESVGASLIFCDTGPEVIRIWSEVKYGCLLPELAAHLRSQTDHRAYTLTLLCSPDLAWQPDPLREAPEADRRWALLDRYRRLLPEYQLIEGADRISDAIRAVEKILRQ